MYTPFDNPPLRREGRGDAGEKLLAECDRMHLEGIVSKRKDGPYRSGKRCDWVKVKCTTWRAANHERWRLFEHR